MDRMLELLGVDTTKRKLERLPVRVQRGIERKAMRTSAKIVQAAAKQRVPVMTGRLKKSIVVRAGKRRRNVQSVIVKTQKVPYAWLVEHGSKHANAHPYMRPAADASKAQVAEAFKATVRDEVKAASRG